ncbi:SMI1/KNR4 family protein [Tenacibaculum tangerinum]|uniref:SMI1/KNR4 family protein n=1 Tax=Tenacibaculum tangerinum TaxID=3038772 RepID=A0ABY8L279_9FLAO|nr:SMI1/KNR4 family protein [Tenacibaculum tangerinum]WGH74762.1 SMI1/KNR4 family protein [Tenacibaculum tangerinum]
MMIIFDKDYDSVKQEDIENLEKLIGSELPEDYKQHMLKYNGGSIPLWYEYIFIHNKRELSLEGFHQLKYGDDNVESYFGHKHDFLYPNLLPIGAITGGYIAMGYQQENKGEIYVYFSDEDPYKIANSFNEFIEGIEVREI